MPTLNSHDRPNEIIDLDLDNYQGKIQMKYIYLDQAPWIELKQRDSNDDTRQYIEQKIDQGEAVIQLLHTLYIETCKYGGKSVREDHADYMYRLSGGHVLRNFHDVSHIEKLNFVETAIGNKFDLESEVRATNAPSMLGTPKLTIDGEDVFESDQINDEVKREFRELLESKIAFDMFIEEEAAERHQDTDWEKELVETIEETREAMDEEFNDNSRRRRAEIHTYFFKDVFFDLISGFASRSHSVDFGNYDFEKYVHQGDEDVEELYQSFPAIYTYLTLSTRRDTEKARKAKPNDVYDLFSLAVAIPYSDIVVTEKMWVTKATRAGLDEAYDTTLLTSLDDLPNAI